MCIHSYADWVEMSATINDPNVAPVVLRKEGEWVGGWVIDVTDAIDAATVEASLKSWHAGEFDEIDWSFVQDAREALGLLPLNLRALPAPLTILAPIVDDEAEYRERVDRARKEAAIRAFSSQEAKRKVAGLPLPPEHAPRMASFTGTNVQAAKVVDPVTV